LHSKLNKQLRKNHRFFEITYQLYIKKKSKFYGTNGSCNSNWGNNGSMVLANYMYTQYQTNFIEVNEGETVIVGPVEYVVTFEGTHEGSKEVKPENTFVKIGIIAKNISDEKTALSGGQFYLIDEKDQKHKAVFGEFTAKDLLIVGLDPGNPIEVTTQFDIPFDEDENYKIVIRPQKDQSTVDTASICLTNC